MARRIKRILRDLPHTRYVLSREFLAVSARKSAQKVPFKFGLYRHYRDRFLARPGVRFGFFFWAPIWEPRVVPDPCSGLVRRGRNRTGRVRPVAPENCESIVRPVLCADHGRSRRPEIAHQLASAYDFFRVIRERSSPSLEWRGRAESDVNGRLFPHPAIGSLGRITMVFAPEPREVSKTPCTCGQARMTTPSVSILLWAAGSSCRGIMGRCLF